MLSIQRFCHEFLDQDGSEFWANIYDNGTRICSVPAPPVRVGMCLQDSSDSKRYLITDVLPILSFNRQTTYYYESTCTRINADVTISRFSQGDKNAFGRPTGPALETIAADLPAHIETSAALRTVQSQEPDGTHDARKLRALIQVADVRVGDRVTTAPAENFMVQAVDRYSHPGLLLLHLGPDNR